MHTAKIQMYNRRTFTTDLPDKQNLSIEVLHGRNNENIFPWEKDSIVHAVQNLYRL